MGLLQKQRNITSWCWHVWLPLLLGLVVYACWRDGSSVGALWLRDGLGESPGAWLGRVGQGLWVPSWVRFQLPDALWMYAGAMALGLVMRRRAWRDIVALLLFSTGLEVAQGVGALGGTFDWWDLLAYGLGLLCGVWQLRRLGIPWCQQECFGGMKRRLVVAVVLLAMGVCHVATSRPRPPTHKALYMSWKAFRSSVKVLPPRPLKRHGKILVHGHLLLINEPNKGIHIIDNHRPSHPVPRAFLRVIGSFDVATKGDALYVDAAVDLLVFRLTYTKRDVKVALVKRVKDVFPYSWRHTIPAGKRIIPYRIERQRGIVIGWKRYKRKQK